MFTMRKGHRIPPALAKKIAAEKAEGQNPLGPGGPGGPGGPPEMGLG
jgi:hypothetical protein